MQEKLRRICHNSFYNFFCLAWREVWPGIKLRENWHYAELAKEIESQTHRIKEGREKEYDILIINVPFRTAKSTFFTICWNAWAWLHDARMKFLTASYVEDLSVEHSFRTRKLIDSIWYNRVMMPKYRMLTDQNMKSYFENDFGGYRMAVSVGRGMGKGGDVFIVDDPISREDSLSEVKRLKALEWVNETVPTRLNDQEVSLIVLVMQRVHQQDPTGDILVKNGLTFKHYNLPAELDAGIKVSPARLKKFYVPEKYFDSDLSTERTVKLLAPAVFAKKTLVKLKRTLGSYTYAAQCQQAPSPPEGGIFKKIWWRIWKPRDLDLPAWSITLPNGQIFTYDLVNLPEQFEDVLLSGDLGFKRGMGNSRVSLQKWGKIKTDKYLLDQTLQQMNYVETRKAVQDFSDRHKEATRFLIEEKANGHAVLSDLQSYIPNLIGKNPGHENKVERASVVSTSHAVPMSAQCEAGHIYIPHPALCPWVQDYIDEFALFPNGTHDDQVDASTQAVNYWNTGFEPFLSVG